MNVMNNKPGPDRPRVARGSPHPSWNLDRPILMASRDADAGDRPPIERRIVTPEEIWAAVDAAG
jgi:hypothetical protein